LKENLFMMIICVELRIPLFLVGKPGSSKSLAKTIVDDAMQGDAAHDALFRHLKQVEDINIGINYVVIHANDVFPVRTLRCT
jgi:hypothetical protein